jgi:hypothetical protein
MPEFYQTHLKGQLTLAQFLLLSLVIQLLQSLRSVKLESLAAKLPLPILAESRRRKLQRFLSLPQLQLETLWFPIWKVWLAQSHPPCQQVYLALDRTQWKAINLLTLSWIKDGRAIPLYWMILPHLGSSNFRQQKSLLLKVLIELKADEVVVLGDREFCSARLAQWLKRQRVYCALRLRCNEYIESADGGWVQLNQLGLAPGMALYFEGIKVTKTHGFGGWNLAAYWRRQYRKRRAKEGWFILTNLDGFQQAMSAYRQRMGIEELFRDCKSGGYHLEETGLEGTRLMALLLILTIAYSTATFEGKKLRQHHLDRYIARSKDAASAPLRHSHFYVGLYAYAWVNFEHFCQATVDALLALSPGKRLFYRRGRQAMELIRSIL